MTDFMQPDRLFSSRQLNQPSDSDNTLQPVQATTSKSNLVSSKLTTKEDVLDAEILWTLYTIEQHHSCSSNDSVKGVFTKMFKDSNIAEGLIGELLKQPI